MSDVGAERRGGSRGGRSTFAEPAADGVPAATPTVPGPSSRPGGAARVEVLRLDLVERRVRQVDVLVATAPATPRAAAGPDGAAWLAEVAALALEDLGDHDRARLLEARAGVGSLLTGRGPSPVAVGVHDDAVRAATLYERSRDVPAAAATHAFAAVAAARAGDVGKALDAAVHALVAFGSLPDGERDPAGEARMADLLGTLCRQLFDHDRALQFFEFASRALGVDGDRARRSRALRSMAEVLLEQVRLDGAGTATPGSASRSELLDRAEHLGRVLLARGEPDALRRVDARRLVAAVLLERGRPEEAWPLLEEATTAAEGTTGADEPALRAARGRCLQHLGRPADALPELDAALTGTVAAGDATGSLPLLRLRSTVREEAGDLAGALDDARHYADAVWSRHERQVGGFMDQVWTRAGLEGQRRDLEARAQDLARLTEQDPLTGLANRRAMERFCAALPPLEAVCVVLLDVDHFKGVNDRFGHAVGDEVLREVAGVLARSVRAVDRAARWGGEEFLLVLPGGPEGLGTEAADRVRRRVAEHGWGRQAPGLRVTVSAGVACGSAGEVPAVLRRADEALYAAKRQGRDRVVTV